MSNRPVFRFAPSPNGYMHLGHAYSAITTYTMCKRMGGRFILRLEDIDLGRTRKAYVDAIYEDLNWLGIEWETPVRRQSEHFSDYQDALNQLLNLGVLYPCFATRKDIAYAIAQKNSPAYPLDPDGSPLYPELHKHMTQSEIDERMRNNEPFAYRINMDTALGHLKNPLVIDCMDQDGRYFQRTAEPQLWGDTVIMRKDTPTSYHLSVVVDDALQGITHVTRGIDLEAATDLHRLLQELLGLPTQNYYHHSLLLDDSGQKLSKSRGSKSLRDLREEGIKAQEILNLNANNQED